LLGITGNPHFDPMHLLSTVLIFGGFVLLASTWRTLYTAQRAQQPATTGAYAHIRHPQYAGFILIMFGFLLQWPTLLTLVMFPILVVMYIRLTHREEREALSAFGEAYARYAARTPAFFPRLGRMFRNEAWVGNDQGPRGDQLIGEPSTLSSGGTAGAFLTSVTADHMERLYRKKWPHRQISISAARSTT
jgi:methanethiol S-methyltransferase